MYNCQHLSLNLLDADVHSAALSDSPSPHAPSPSVSCLAQEEGKGISLAPGSAEQWKGSVACSCSPLTLTPPQPGQPSLQNGDGLQRGTAHLLVHGGQFCSQGSPASLLTSSHSQHFKSFPLLLKKSPASCHGHMRSGPGCLIQSPFPPSLLSQWPALCPLQCLDSASLSLRVFAPAPVSTWKLLLPALPVAASFSSIFQLSA